MARQLRAGRISNDERYIILNELGKIASKKYNEYLLENAGSYNLQRLRNSLQWEPDIKEFDNKYWIDAGSEEMNKIANYFEYGTGIFNTSTKRGAKQYILPKQGPYMIWKDHTSQKMIFAKRTKGVRPVLMMTKAVAYIRHNRDVLIRRIRFQKNI